MKEFVAHLGKRIIVQTAIKPKGGKLRAGDLDARGCFLLRNRPGMSVIGIISSMLLECPFQVSI